MDKLTLLSNFITSIVNESSESVEAGEAAMREYIKQKSKFVLNRKNSALVEFAQKAEKFKADLLEYIQQNGGEHPIRLDGEKVLVNGTVVGFIKNDLPNTDDPDAWEAQMNGGMNFISADGKFSKEFNDVADLFKFIATQYLGGQHA